MTKTIWVATTNRDKVKEISALLSSAGFEVKSPLELPAYTAPHENGATFKDNALIKAKFLHGIRKDAWVLSDDSGLEVDALNGLPGVHSARYGGPRASAMENNSKLLKAISMKPPGTPRTARFKCVLCLMVPEGMTFSPDQLTPKPTAEGESEKTPIVGASMSIGSLGEIYFEGLLEGEISRQEKGKTGFGYDPVFIPQGNTQTIAELGLAVKNKLSHRAKALSLFKEFLSR